MLPLPASVPLTLWEGDEVDFQIRLLDVDRVPLDLTDFPVAKAQIRSNPDSAGPDAEFVVTVLDQSDLATRGRISVFLPTTEADKLRAGAAFWDLQLERSNGTGRRTHVWGKVKVLDEYTR